MSTNMRNPAIRRIMADVRELKFNPSSRYHAAPLEDNPFEWHFTIRGPEGTAFEGGIYHGRILLPAEYPMKPPNIVFLTVSVFLSDFFALHSTIIVTSPSLFSFPFQKNGRFDVGVKICLSISAYHEETWQPAWGVRTMLEAIISFLPSEGAGAIGALDYTPVERKKLAVEVRSVF
jgi:ubiquitin-conjugating enzyme E2 J1